VRSVVRRLYDTDAGPVAFQYPPRIELGDLAITTPFDLARTLRRKPRELAAELAPQLAAVGGVRKVEVAGGGYVTSSCIGTRSSASCTTA